MRRTRRAAAITFAILLASAPALPAQDRGLGVKGGVNVATQQVSGEADAPVPSVRIGAVVGAFYILPVASWLGLQVEGLYTAKGSKLESFGISSTAQIDYVEVPLLARVQLGTGHRHYYVEGGAAPAFRVRARAVTSFTGATESLDITDQVETIDLGVVGGGGIVLGAFSIDGRYTFGVRDVDADKTDSSRTKNRVLAVTAGYRF